MGRITFGKQFNSGFERLDSLPNFTVTVTGDSNNKFVEIYTDKLVYSAHYTDGLINGEVIDHYLSGALHSVKNMKNGACHGQKTVWYKNGVMKKQVEYIDGEINECQEWSKNGQLIHIQKNIDGNQTRTWWYESGQLQIDRKNNGECQEWYESGQLAKKYTLKNDMPDGLYQEWYESGQLKVEYTRINGMYEGLFQEWYESGQLRKECACMHNVQHGLTQEWYESGQLNKEIMYTNGKVDGLCQMWDETGQLIQGGETIYCDSEKN